MSPSCQQYAQCWPVGATPSTVWHEPRSTAVQHAVPLAPRASMAGLATKALLTPAQAVAAARIWLLSVSYHLKKRAYCRDIRE